MIIDFLLVSGSYFGTGVTGDLFRYWEQQGFFSHILPFLLIFALIYGVLTKSNIFNDNKPVNAIIAIAIGLMASQFSMVNEFFSEFFPRFGIGLVILLIFLIFVGMFIDTTEEKSKWINNVFLGVAGIIVLSILVNTSEALSWYSGNFWSNNWVELLTWIFLGVMIVLVIVKGGTKERSK